MGNRGMALVAALAALAVAGCSEGDDDSGAATTRAATTVAEPSSSAPPTTAPESTTPDRTMPTFTVPPPPPTTAPPVLPDPVVRQRIVVTGPEEVVFDWTTDQCEPEHIPDIAARAYRDAEGRVQLTIGHYVTYRMTGPNLNDVATDCSTVQLRSDYDPDPAQFNDSEWIASPYTFDGETVYAITHNEYRGDTHRGARPGQCPSGQRLPCLDTSFTMQVSTDGGDTFTDIAPPPGHLVATLPYQYIDDSIPTGIRQPSDIIEGPDGYFYLFGNISDHPSEEQWVCAMRTDDLADPASWRYWDGTDFAGVWKNPYLETVDPAVDKCAPLALPELSGGVQESIVYDESLGAYVMVGMGDRPGSFGTEWGVLYATSTDLVDWTFREFLIELPMNPSVADPDNETVHAYPSIIDPDSASLNFSTSDGEMYLYISRFNFGGNSLDRDLLRFPIAVEEYAVDPPDWNFDDPADIDPDAGGWTAENDIEPLATTDGVLPVVPSGTDPFLTIYGLDTPAGYDRLHVTMKVPAGVENALQLFFTTAADPDVTESKSMLIPYTGTGEFEEFVFDFSGVPTWAGTITSLRIDPIEGRTDTIELDRVWFPTSG